MKVAKRLAMKTATTMLSPMKKSTTKVTFVEPVVESTHSQDNPQDSRKDKKVTVVEPAPSQDDQKKADKKEKKKKAEEETKRKIEEFALKYGDHVPSIEIFRSHFTATQQQSIWQRFAGMRKKIKTVGQAWEALKTMGYREGKTEIKDRSMLEYICMPDNQK